MSESLSIHHDVGGHQFETTVDGHRAYLAYMDLGKQTLDIYRTFVPDSLRGRGIAAALTEHALQYADRMGYSVIPSCSYVERFRFRLAQPRWRFGSTSLSLACMLRMLFSVVAQSMQASVMETPY